MIVVEGYDAAGKSTLAQALARHFKMKVTTIGGPTGDIQDCIDWLNRCMDRFTGRYVQDRVTHVSEIVYSIHRNPLKAGIAMSRLSDLRQCRGFVYCRPPTETILESLRTQHVVKPYDKPDHLVRVQNDAQNMIAVYDAVARCVSTYAPAISYDRTQPPSEYRKVIAFLEERLQ